MTRYQWDKRHSWVWTAWGEAYDSTNLIGSWDNGWDLPCHILEKKDYVDRSVYAAAMEQTWAMWKNLA